MDWLKEHVYLAAWLAIPIAILVPILQTIFKKTDETDWLSVLKYLAFFISLAVMFTPTFDESARTSARVLVFMGVGFFFASGGR